MKTTIIQLEPHDDIVSAKDKMNWGQAGRILVIWPERGRVLARRLDLVLLQRHSTALGAQLALVTRDSDVRNYARQLSIPVFNSTRKAQRSHWRLPRAERQARARRKVLFTPQEGRETSAAALLPERPMQPVRHLGTLPRMAVFTLGVLAHLSIAAVLLPKAEISLSPSMQTQALTLTVQANQAAKAIHLSGIAPTHARTVVVEGRSYRPSTGSAVLADQPASGAVLFTNLTDAQVRIPTGAVVRSLDPDGPRFAVTRSGVIPAGPGETLSLMVKALRPGAQGNQPAAAISILEGPLSTQATATNPQPMRGGRDLRTLAPTSDDQNQLKEELLEQLHASALAEIQAGLQPGDVLLPSTLAQRRILDETYDPAPGEPADQMSLNLRVEFEAQVVRGSDLQNLAAGVLDANRMQGFSPVPDSMAFKNLTRPRLNESGVPAWQLRASREVQAVLAPAQAVRLAAGLSPEQARQRLAEDLPLDTAPQIALEPEWWPRLPVLPFRITVKVD